MFETLAAGIEELRAFDPPIAGGQTYNDAIIEMERLHSQLEAVIAEKEAIWKHRGCWQADGARSAAAWIAARTKKPIGEGRRRICNGEVFLDAPVIADAWVAGEISSTHVDLLRKVRTPATEEYWQRDIELLVRQAKAMKFMHFRKSIAYWYQQADPDGAEKNAAKRALGRRFHLSQSLDNIWYGNLELPAVDGYVLKQEIDRIEQELYREEKRTGNIWRTTPQRRADAVVEMARRCRTAPADGIRPPILISVLVGHESVLRLCELGNGTVITPGELLPWLDQAYIERLVFDTPSRVIDVGEERRLFVGATRKAVLFAGRECYRTDICDAPLDELEADHITPYSEGGRTLVENGRPACGFHNRLRNQQPDTG